MGTLRIQLGCLHIERCATAFFEKLVDVCSSVYKCFGLVENGGMKCEQGFKKRGLPCFVGQLYWQAVLNNPLFRSAASGNWKRFRMLLEYWWWAVLMWKKVLQGKNLI